MKKSFIFMICLVFIMSCCLISALQATIEDIEEGYIRTLEEDDIIIFKEFDDEYHQVKLLSVGSDTARIQSAIGSTPVAYELEEGENVKIDVTGDGIEDIKVTIISLGYNEAKIELGLAQEEVVDLTSSDNTTDDSTNQSNEGDAVDDNEEESSGYGLWTTIIIVLVVLIILFFLWKRK
jgi:hypothetical protein